MNYDLQTVCAFTFTGICIIFAGFYSFLNRIYTYWDKKNVKGPLPRYFIGTWDGFDKKFLGSEDYSNVLKYGKVLGTYDGFTPNLLVTDLNMIQEILHTSADKFQNIRLVSVNSEILKNSLLFLCGGGKPEIQMRMGSLLDPQEIGKLIPKILSSTDILINNIMKDRKENGLVNITSCVMEFVDEATALAILGIELNADDKLKNEFAANMRQIFKVKSPQSVWSLLPFLYGTGSKENWICPEKSLQYFVNFIISKMSESSSKDTLTEENAYSLIELMFRAANNEKKLIEKSNEDGNQELVLTDSTIISICLASVLSLANVTRTLVVLAIYALANNEDVQEKMYKEIQDKFKAISHDEVQNSKYLDCIVKEVLRLYPFEFRLERVTVDKVRLGDIELDKNVRVSVPLYALHQLEEFYPNAKEFDPERFSKPSFEDEFIYSYLPFGQAGFNGSDISLQLGVLASKVCLIRLINKFKFSSMAKLSWHRLFQEGFTGVPQPEMIGIFAETRF